MRRLVAIHSPHAQHAVNKLAETAIAGMRHTPVI
jgi:hypothetical protein